MNNEELKTMAEEVRLLYRTNQITREDAVLRLKPYEAYFNALSKEIAKKYNQKPYKFNFNSFMR